MRALIALFAAALFTTAVADDTSKSGEKSMRGADAKFESLDRNNDKQLSRTEAKEDDTLTAHFASVDQDSDGFVSKSEYTAKMQSSESKSGSDRY